MNIVEAQILEYYRKVKLANKEATKKEAFKDLLNRLYAKDSDILKIIDKITLGAEQTIFNIPRRDVLHKGSADSLFNKIIIEFENNLKVTGKHAKEQLAGYLLGQFNEGEGYNFTLIASDFINWKVYSPDITCLDKLDAINEEELILNEVQSCSFVLNETNAEEFYYWIDRFLFKEEKQKATLRRIEEAFGYQSNVFIESYRELKSWFNEAKKQSEIQVSFEQWSKFLSIAYSSFNASEEKFLIHTYLSVFSKLLAYKVVSKDDFIDDDEMKAILDGSIFQSYNISNFVDNDFFHWVKKDQNFFRLKKVFRLITQEISVFDFENVDEDILKGVYQELIDLDTRHSLGEYYTPDWLCERIVNEFSFSTTDKILDPACGSGSFLRAVIHNLKKVNPGVEVYELNNQVYGIDIHPLSVQIAKTTLLLALGKDVIKSKKPVHLNVILANTLLAPEGVQNLWGNQFSLPIDKKKYVLNTQVFDDVDLFDIALDICEKLSDQTFEKPKLTPGTFTKILSSNYTSGGLNEQITESFYSIYEGLKDVKEKGRNGIWKFIIQNLYKPYFLKSKFDYVIGNPPWFTYSSIQNAEYQDILNALAVKYEVKPHKIADYPHLEIAAIFLAYCNNYFLKDTGKLAFVLPRSFFNGSQHDNTRSGAAKGFKVTNIWDLASVIPLFNIPSCVLFTEKAFVKRSLPSDGQNGLLFVGKLPSHNCTYEEAKPLLMETDIILFYAKQGKATAYSTHKTQKRDRINPYKEKFKQGATLVPRTLYFIELTQDPPPDFEDRTINIKTSNQVIPEAKTPWKDLSLSGRIESKFIFKTALSRSILPYALLQPDYVVLPITINKASGSIKTITLHSSESLMHQGYLNASSWFGQVEKYWETYKTEKSSRMSNIGRLDFQRGISEQDLNCQFLVLYNASAKNANATIFKRNDLDLEFIVESVSYVYYTNEENEAYYLTAILNSTVPNELIKDFQARGLYGARHVHKKILDVYFPKYDCNDNNHMKLAELSKLSHGKAMKFLQDKPPHQELTAMRLGRLRLEIKSHLSKELKEIDRIVKRIL
ncbi:MAG: N-6 DNA methylase [Bacteroidales bacterium]|jgi:hypothetical protein|nr:N-6 DNA methylase [Bacteroidales bacterium]